MLQAFGKATDGELLYITAVFFALFIAVAAVHFFPYKDDG